MEETVQRCVDFMRTLSTREQNFVMQAGLSWSPEDATALLNDAYKMAGVCRRCREKADDIMEHGMCPSCGYDAAADAARFELYADPAELVNF
jgi:rRNA maturation endonuclease Nob1